MSVAFQLVAAACALLPMAKTVAKVRALAAAAKETFCPVFFKRSTSRGGCHTLRLPAGQLNSVKEPGFLVRFRLASAGISARRKLIRLPLPAGSLDRPAVAGWTGLHH
ncbi:hypothetical protein GCM10017687_07870 [Streptomyces echinatus]